MRNNSVHDFCFNLDVPPSSGTLLTIFGGRVDDLRAVLLEERLPDGWESHVREPMGLTIAVFNKTVLGIEMDVEEEIRDGLKSVL